MQTVIRFCEISVVQLFVCLFEYSRIELIGTLFALVIKCHTEQDIVMGIDDRLAHDAVRVPVNMAAIFAVAVNAESLLDLSVRIIEILPARLDSFIVRQNPVAVLLSLNRTSPLLGRHVLMV